MRIEKAGASTCTGFFVPETTRIAPLMTPSQSRVLIQIIHISWPKAARGGELATKRNTVPMALAIEENHWPNDTSTFFIERTEWGEANDFTAPFSRVYYQADSNETFRYKCLSVQRIRHGL